MRKVGPNLGGPHRPSMVRSLSLFLVQGQFPGVLFCFQILYLLDISVKDLNTDIFLIISDPSLLGSFLAECESLCPCEYRERPGCGKNQCES